MRQRMTVRQCVFRFLCILVAVEAFFFVILHGLLDWPVWTVLVPAGLMLATLARSLEPDRLDVALRLERAFGLWLPDVLPRESDLTAGQLHDRVCESMRKAGRRVPRGSWRRVQATLADASGESPRRIGPGTRLRTD
jgi:hypothetical protein